MSNSLRDQLLAAGLKPSKPAAPAPSQNRPSRHEGGGKPGAAARPQGRPPHPAGGRHTPHGGPPKGKPAEPRKSGPPRPRSQEEIDLARAYALRANAERTEREAEQRAAEQRKREKAERKLKLTALLDGKAQNDAAAEIARNFEYTGKIRRIYVRADQLAALNAGDLGVVQHDGRFLLVTRELAVAVRELFPSVVAVLHEPGELAAGDDGVPSDLVW